VGQASGLPVSGASGPVSRLQNLTCSRRIFPFKLIKVAEPSLHPAIRPAAPPPSEAALGSLPRKLSRLAPCPERLRGWLPAPKAFGVALPDPCTPPPQRLQLASPQGCLRARAGLGFGGRFSETVGQRNDQPSPGRFPEEPMISKSLGHSGLRYQLRLMIPKKMWVMTRALAESVGPGKVRKLF
jgi:hypothetical protein